MGFHERTQFGSAEKHAMTGSLIYDAQDRTFVDDISDLHGKGSATGDELEGPVDRIDDPHGFATAYRVVRALLGEDVVIRKL